MFIYLLGNLSINQKFLDITFAVLQFPLISVITLFSMTFFFFTSKGFSTLRDLHYFDLVVPLVLSLLSVSK